MVPVPNPAELTALPAPLRRPAAVAIASAALVFAVLATRYAHATRAGRVDTRVEPLVDAIVSAPEWVLQQVVTMGSPPSVVLLALALATVCLSLGQRRLALLAVVGPGLTGVAIVLLKPAIGRTIDGSYAFPSGHTGGATAVGLIVALLVVGRVRPGRNWGAVILATCPLLLGGAVAAAMIATNVHYPTDTVGGFCAAVVVVLGSALLIEWLAGRRGRAPGD